MKRVMIWATALMLMVAGMAVSQEANAGLFNRKSDCCKPQKCKKCVQDQAVLRASPMLCS